MDTVWETLAKRWLKVALVTLIITMSAITLARTLETKRIGQEAVPLNWASEIGTLFQHTVSEPTLVPAVSFFPLFYQRLKPGIDYLASYEVDRRGYHLAYQGWLAIGMPWPAYQEYSVTTDDGGQAIIIKDHYRWVFAPVPDDLFFTQTRRILERLEQSSVRVFALQLNPKTRQDEEGLRAAAERNGFTITEFTLLKYGALWRTRVNAEKPQPAGQQGNPATTTP